MLQHVLQVMVMAVKVGLDFVFVQQRQNIFDKFGGVAMFTAGINGMMPVDDFPLRL